MERDEGYPEITMLTEIAKFYEITTDELLYGSRTQNNVKTEVTLEQKVEFPEKTKTFLIVSATLNIISFVAFLLFVRL